MLGEGCDRGVRSGVAEGEGVAGVDQVMEAPLRHRSAMAALRVSTALSPFFMVATYWRSLRFWRRGDRISACGPISSMITSLGILEHASLNCTRLAYPCVCSSTLASLGHCRLQHYLVQMAASQRFISRCMWSLEDNLVGSRAEGSLRALIVHGVCRRQPCGRACLWLRHNLLQGCRDSEHYNDVLSCQCWLRAFQEPH